MTIPTGQIAPPAPPKLGGQRPLTANKPPAPQAPLLTGQRGLEPGQAAMVRQKAIQRVVA